MNQGDGEKRMAAGTGRSQQTTKGLGRPIPPDSKRPHGRDQGSTAPAGSGRGTWGLPVIIAFLVGGVVGWVGSTRLQAGRSGGRRHRHHASKASPIAIQTYLRGVDYPVQKDALLATARAEGADAAVLRTLAQLPDMRYRSPIEVSRAIGRLA